MKNIKDILNAQAVINPQDSEKNTFPGRREQNFKDTLPEAFPEELRDPNQAEPVKCTICQDRGIILDGEVAYPCSCMQVRKAENQFRTARIPRELLKCRFNQFRFDYYDSENGDESHREVARRALGAAEDFVKEYKLNANSPGLMFTGPVGSGKTFLAASIANELMAAQFQILFIVVPDLLDELRASYKSEKNELDLLDAARTVPVLILDDMGAHNYSDWSRNRIYSIINYRLNEWLPTIITTNLSLDEMEEYLGLRTTSRIIQSARIFRLTVEKDIRHQMYHEREGKK